MRVPSVLMIRQPPAYVPAAIANAALAITHSGGSAPASRWPPATSASAMIPIVFCASFVPCVNATNAPETSWNRRNTRLTLPGERRRISHVIPIINPAPSASPANGAISDGISTFSRSPSHWTTSNPAAATAEPRTPPISAWLELEGSPRYHVTRFQVIAPTSPAMTTSSVITSGITMPFAIVAATSRETNAPATLSTAAESTAALGDMARVETLVAIEFAVSWKPFVKSKKSAIATTATSVSSISALRVLDGDVRDDVRRGLARVDRPLQSLVDVLPADHDQGVDAVVAEERRDRVVDDP